VRRDRSARDATDAPRYGERMAMQTMHRSSVVCALGLLGLLGCTPGADKVCVQVVDHEARARGTSLPDAERKGAIDRCVQRMDGEKQKDASKYGCLAKCVMASSDVAGVQKCEETCGTKGAALEPPPGEAPAPPAGAAPTGGCRDSCKRTLDACMTGCGDDSHCHEKCNADYTKCGVDCVHGPRW
jgi:hypothetical protein